MNWVLAYADAIASGEIITSKKVATFYAARAAEIRNPQGRWVFDEELGRDPIDFAEDFCRQSKGEWTRQPIKLDLWEKAFVQALFGFVDVETRERRYNEALLLVARKNGKSTLLSAIALYMLVGDGEGGAEVYSVATKLDQAKIVFRESVKMVKQSPDLSRHVRKTKTELSFAATFSLFAPLASDSKSMDGLNSHCVIIDELHAIKDRNLYDVMKKSTSARRQPLMIAITTAGTVRECIYDDQYDYASRVIEGEVEDDRFMAVLYELDDREEWTNPAMWIKANPGLGTIKRLSYLTEMVQKAKQDPKVLPDVLTKDFNIRDTVVGAWLTFDDANNKAEFTMDEVRDSYAIGGADLSATTDLSCATLIVMKPGSETKYVLQHYFLPRALLDKRVKEDKIPYNRWEERGLLTLCEGTKVRYSDITAWFKKMVDEFGIRPLWVLYDPWSSQYWIDEMAGLGFNMEICRQGAPSMSQPMKELEGDLKAHQVNYNNSPVLKWCLTNTSIRRDDNDNIRPVKGQHQRQRIDGAVSLIIAYVGLYRHMADYMTMIGR
jgi:phage terminase large subunit-like protein